MRTIVFALVAFLPAACALALLLGVAACDRLPTAASTELAGTFERVRADGADLPAEIWRDATGIGVLHFAFHEGGTVTRTSRFVVTDLASGEAEVMDRVLEKEYRRQGRRIEIGWFEPCPPSANCVPNDTGRIRSGRIELELARWSTGERPTFTDRRM